MIEQYHIHRNVAVNVKVHISVVPWQVLIVWRKGYIYQGGCHAVSVPLVYYSIL